MDTKQGLLMEEVLTSAVGVLGAMLIDERAVGPMLMAVSEDDFLLPEQKSVFRAIRELYTEGSKVDGILVNERLGGKYNTYLADLMNMTPTAANADEYAKSLRKSSRKWHLRELGTQIAEADDDEQLRALFDKGNLLLCERHDVRRVTMEQAFRSFLSRKDGGTEEKYLRFGFPKLDEQLHIGKGDMVVVGGYPSAGKTAFALQVAFHIAQEKRVGFFSYETGADKLYDRAVACQTQTSFARIMRNKLNENDYKRIWGMRQYMTAPQLEFLETSGMTVSGIGAYAMAQHYDVIVIDYLQKIPGVRATDEFQRVSQVSNDLQQLGRRTGKTIIALSQLSRAKDGSNNAPTMSSLRQSGQIEQDADAVLLLYKENPKDYCSRRVLDIAKNKDGIAGVGMLLDFDGDKQFFTQEKKQVSKTETTSKNWNTERYYEEIAKQAKTLDNPSASHTADNLPSIGES